MSIDLKHTFFVLALSASGHAIAADSDMYRDVEYHGFASVGYIDTSGNNFYGDTRNGGAFDYYEAGINAFASLNPNVSLAGQVLSRKAGQTDNGSVRIDYGFVDMHTSRLGETDYGVRIGRVRNPMGLYNETRDVVFTRPTILLPQSVYFEGTGVREMLFSSDAVQLYGDWALGDDLTSFKLSLARSKPASNQTLRNFSTSLPPGTPLSIDVRQPVFAQILHEQDGGQQRYAFSYVDMGLAGQFGAVPFTLDMRLYILSGQYNAENWSFTSEYQLMDADSTMSGVPSKSKSDGFYLQYQYRFTPRWTGLLRQDFSYPDRNHRGTNPSRDSTVGLVWRPQQNLQVNAEYHSISGTAGVPVPDNPGGLVHHTNLLAVMLGVRF